MQNKNISLQKENYFRKLYKIDKRTYDIYDSDSLLYLGTFYECMEEVLNKEENGKLFLNKYFHLKNKKS